MSEPAGITETALVAYLVTSGLLSPRHVVDGSLRVDRAGGRNVNFLITTACGPLYLVKQSRDEGGELGREAAVYAFLNQISTPADVRDAVPGLVANRTGDKLLVFEQVDGHDLRRHHTRLGRCPSWTAVQSGRLLAAVHGISTAGVPAELYRTPAGPSSAVVHRPDERIFTACSRAVVDLIALVQSDRGLCAALDALVADWRPSAFAHHDIRWDNLLVTRTTAGRTALRLVDWETAGVGDPDHDVGSLFAEYLSHWLQSIPFTSAGAAGDDARFARFPVDAMQRAVRSAWAGYADTLRLPPDERADRVVRSTRHAGARLVQRALELDQDAAAMSVLAVCHLQVAARIMADPRSAAAGLLGLDAEAVS